MSMDFAWGHEQRYCRTAFCSEGLCQNRFRCVSSWAVNTKLFCNNWSIFWADHKKICSPLVGLLRSCSSHCWSGLRWLCTKKAGGGGAGVFNSRIISLSKSFGEFEQKSPATFVEFFHQHKRQNHCMLYLGVQHLDGINFEIILMRDEL